MPPGQLNCGWVCQITHKHPDSQRPLFGRIGFVSACQPRSALGQLIQHGAGGYGRAVSGRARRTVTDSGAVLRVYWLIAALNVAAGPAGSSAVFDFGALGPGPARGPGGVQLGAGLCPPRRCCRCHRRAGSASSGPRLLPISGAGCPPSQAPPGRAGTQPRRDAHRAQGGLSPGWRLAGRRPGRRARRPGRAGRREDDSGATLVPGWRPGELATSSAACCAACWRPAAWPATASPDRRHRRSADPPRWGSGPGGTASSAPPGQRARPGSLPRRRARVCPDADAFAVSRQPGPPAGAWPELPRYRERGRARPPRLAAGSFISCGAFAGPGRARAHARLPGAILEGRAARLHGDREAVHRGRVRCTVVFIQYQYPRSRNRVQGHGAEDPGSVH